MAFELYYLQELSKDSGGVQQSKIFQLKSKLNKEKLSLNDYQNLFKSDVSKVDLSNKVYQFFAQLIMINIIPFNATARVIESQAPSSSEVNADDILSITVDSADQLYCNGRPVNKEQLFSMAKTHLDKRRSSAVILILFSPKSNLDFYMSIFNGLKQINEDLRNQYSRTVYKKEFKELSATEQSDVKAQFPFSVTEVEKDE
jgi:biopolymer transport protein ExbD